jgi:hypothetical protein
VARAARGRHRAVRRRRGRITPAPADGLEPERGRACGLVAGRSADPVQDVRRRGRPTLHRRRRRPRPPPRDAGAPAGIRRARARERLVLARRTVDRARDDGRRDK